MKTFTKKDIFIETILEKIEKVNYEEWEYYLKDLKKFKPHNPFTNTYYKDKNLFMILLFTCVYGYSSSKFATFKQINEAGGKVKKDSKSIPIEFYSFTVRSKNNNKIKISFDDYKLLSKEEKEKFYIKPFLKSYRIFNFDCIENLEDLNLKIEEEEIHLTNDINDNEDIENLISNLITSKDLNLKFEESSVAFYNSSKDYVSIPKKIFFKNESKYYSTVFHELIHWTGNIKRLNREMKNSKNSEKYCFEELIAEIGSMILCIDFGIYEEFINSIKYLKGWSKDLEDKEILLRNAFSQSKKAVDYMIK